MAYNTHYTESSGWTNDATPNDADHVADIYASLGPRYSASEYGTVQAAVTAAETAGGGVVFIPPGTWDENIVVGATDNTAEITIQGSGASSILTAPSTSSDILTITDMSRVAVRDIYLWGEWQTGVRGLVLEGVSLSRFDNIMGKNFQGNGALIDITCTATNGSTRNTFSHIHTDDNTIGFLNFDNGGQSGRYISLCSFTGVSAIITNNATVAAINFVRGVDNNRFAGVTRLDLNTGANATVGVAMNPGAVAGGNEVYENHFDDLMIDNDGASKTPIVINECNNWGYSEIHYRPGGSEGVGAGNTIASNGYAHVFEEGVGGDGSILQVVSMSSANYTALSGNEDPNTLYVING